MMLESSFHILGISFIIFILPLLFYWYFTSASKYWNRRGIKSKQPRSILKSYFFPSKKPVQVVETESYKLGRIYGEFVPTFLSAVPSLVVSDPELVRDILVKDFNVFPNRQKTSLHPDEVMKNVLTNLRDEDWKRVRSLISPIFSTAKIKKVLSIFKDSSNTLIQNFKKAIKKGDLIELKKLYETFSMDVIASAAFSSKVESHNNPDNIFVRKARETFKKQGFKALLYLILPLPLLKILERFTTKSSLFFKNVTLEVIAERQKTGERRNDFLQLLMDVSDQRLMEEKDDKDEDIAKNYGDDAAEHPVFKTSHLKHISRNEMVAQCVVFIFAGYHTTSLALSFTTYLLAIHEEEQEKCYKEIRKVLGETDGELNYETLQKMKYLDNVISESLRIYPPAFRISRTAEVNYELGNTGIVVPKGMTVHIPLYAMHHDPELFPDPERFDPSRFSNKRRLKQIPYTYMPFGAGPRNCLGMRFALMEIKMCLAFVLSVFHIKKSPETKEPLEFYGGGGRPLINPKDIVVSMDIRDSFKE